MRRTIPFAVGALVFGLLAGPARAAGAREAVEGPVPAPVMVAQAPPADPAPASPAGPATPAAPPEGTTAPDEGPEEREVTRVPLVGVERGGVLLGGGQIIIDSSVQYQYTSSSRIILTGFSVIPLIVLGTLESENLRSDTLTGNLSLGYGIRSDLQVGLQLPYTYIATTTNRISSDTVSLTEHSSSSWGVGDLGLSASYQFLYERNWWPDLTLGLAFRFPTGRSQFDIYEDVAKKGSAGVLSIEQFVRAIEDEGAPIGSGFYSITPSLSFVRSLDPAVLYGTFSYSHSFEDNKTLISITGQEVEGGVVLRPTVQKADIQPGDTYSLSIGMALSLSREMSFNFSFSDAITFPTSRDGKKIGDTRINVAQFNAGFALALSKKVTIEFTGTAGLTSDAPEFGLRFGMPLRFESIEDLYSSIRTVLPFLPPTK